MPKKPAAPVLDEDQDAIDDETFVELTADEKRLHAAYQIRRQFAQVRPPV